MSGYSKKQDLKYELLNIYNNKENYTLISLYRELLIYNKKIQIYVSNDIYDSYINELYNIIDTYLYDYDNIEDYKCIYNCINIIIANL